MVILPKFINKLVNTIGFIYPFLISTSLVFLALESFTYTGYFFNIIYLPTPLLFFLTILSGIIILFFGHKNTNLLSDKLTSFFSYALILFSLPVIIINIVLKRLEEINYTNYVFSTYHLNLNSFRYFVYLSVFLAIFGILRTNTESMKQKFITSILIKKMIDFMQTLFTPIYVVTLISFLIEIFKYPGFISKYFIISPTTFFMILLLSTLPSLGKKIDKRLYVVNKVIFLILVISYFVFGVLQGVFYNNFVFEKLHINTEPLLTLTILTLFVIIIKSLSENKLILQNISYKKRSFSRYLTVLLSISLIIIYATINTSKSINDALISTSKILSRLDFTYDQKMNMTWPTFYNYMKFVKENTPDNARIAIPPAEEHWLHTGNLVLVNYFLYPRKLFEGTIYSLPKEKIDYILLAKGLWNRGESDFGWPKVFLKDVEVNYLNTDQGVFETYFGDFDPNYERNKNSWGLIKIKQN